MPSLEILMAFALATFIFAYIPGPALLYTAGQTIARGRKAGLNAALGIHIGGYAHVIAAAFGLSAIFNNVPELYTLLKMTGAIYLIFLGFRMLRKPDDHIDATAPANKSSRHAFFESVTVEVLNPKTAIFFLAFLPQFVDASASLAITLQFLILGTFVNLVFSSADILCVLTATTLVQRFKKSNNGQRIARVIGGSILIGLGARLALDRQ